MRRRTFITLLGGAVSAWPLIARARQSERMRRIGVLLPAAPDDAEFQSWVGAFLQGLAQSGWITGRNIRVETRWTKFDAEETRKYAADLVALAPDVIVASGNSTVGPLLRLTRTVPIVFPAAADPVAAGLVVRHRECLPAIYAYRGHVVSGGLMSYGLDNLDQYRRAAGYVDRILRGEKPADLPVQAPTKYELVINLKTAKALGLQISPTLLARADELIE